MYYIDVQDNLGEQSTQWGYCGWMDLVYKVTLTLSRCGTGVFTIMTIARACCYVFNPMPLECAGACAQRNDNDNQQNAPQHKHLTIQYSSVGCQVYLTPSVIDLLL